jgi:hypothetical protein
MRYFMLGAALMLSLFVAPPIVDAQFSSMSGLQDNLELQLTPEHPAPNQTVQVKVVGYGINLNDAIIEWYVNGTLIGRNVQETSFTTRGAGSPSTLSVVVAPEGSSPITKQISVYPTEVIMLWEADTFTPPLYRGKALPSSDSSVRIVALPNFVRTNGTVMDPRDLVYTWKKGGSTLGPQSGMGKNTLEIASEKMYRSELYRVEVESPDGVFQGEGQVTIASYAPEVLLYENDPVLGMRFERALMEGYTLKNEEVMVTGVPYFFSTEARSDPTLAFTWRMNGSEVESARNDQSSVTFRLSGAGEGTARIALDVQHLSKILQVAKHSFSIMFSGTTQQNTSF